MKLYTSVYEGAVKDDYGRHPVFFIAQNEHLLYFNTGYYYSNIQLLYNAYVNDSCPEPSASFGSAKHKDWKDIFLFEFDNIDELKEMYPEEFI